MLRLAAIFLLFTVVQVQASCSGAGYVQFNSASSCYSLKIASPVGQPTWNEALTKCQVDGANLASIKDKESQAFLNAILIVSRSSAGVWIGLNDDDNDGTLQWADGSPFDGSVWENWASGAPGTVNQMCVQMVPDDYTPGLWTAVPCTTENTLYYICEMDADVGSTADPLPACQTTGAADPDYFPYYGYCYKIITEPLSYEDARVRCEGTGDEAFLASVRSGYHDSIIEALMLDEGQTSTWIGLKSTNGRFAWDDKNFMRFTNWGMLEPNMTASSSGCVSKDEPTGEWFDGDCNELKTSICAITTDPEIVPEDPTYGDCPEGWNTEGYECYHYVNQNLTRDAAIDECKNIYPDATISVPHGMTPFNWDRYSISVPLDIWIGVFRNNDEKFETLDGSIFDYVNWAVGQPEGMGPTDTCIIVSVTEQGEAFWSGQGCTNEHTFFCAFPQITSPREMGECQSGWFKFGNKCYQHFNERLTFGEAQRQCDSKAIGGDLASVVNGEQQALFNFLMKPWAGADSEGGVWIGLYDSSNTGAFKWTNGNGYGIDLYTNWAPGQPDGYLDFFDETMDKNDCVKMMADPMTPGLWDDVSCSTNELTYLCECYLDPLLPTPEPDPTSACQAGYMAVADSCYRFITDAMTFYGAQMACSNDGASLVSIEDGYDQGLVQFVLAISSDITTAWIGINDEDGDGEYTRIDGRPVTYVNWANDEPSGGMCVTVRPAGLWLESQCDQLHASICKTNSTDIPVTPAPEVSYCDDGWVYYEPTNTCYLIDTYRLENEVSTMYITYADAEKSCRSMEARLVSLHSPEQNDWFYFQTRFTLGERKIWLGMHRSSDGLLKWEDGSLVNYVNWADNEPSGASQGTDCVTYYAGNQGLGQWSDTSCFELNAYACQKDPYPGTKPIVPLCGPGWDNNPIRSDDCYYLSLPEDDVLSWDEAESYCNEMGAHLASLVTFEDKVFIGNLLQQRLPDNTESWPWTGYRRLPGSTEFTWSDNSESRITVWSDDQPDSMDDDCAAVELEGAYNTLNNINCGLQRPFICKRNFDSMTPITPMPTPSPGGGCSLQGRHIGNKCYRLDTEPLSWDDARTSCAEFPNGDLTSIPIYAVQALMSSLVKQVDFDDIWLGMTSRMPYDSFAKEFHWIDGTSLAFTNWGSGQPSLSTEEEHCVKMLTDPDSPGKWYDDMCDQRYPYVCQYDLDPNVTPGPVATSAPCPDGFEGTGTICFRIETTERTFPNALDMCRSVGGILAPVMDGYEDAFVELLMYSADVESVWIGLQSDEGTSGRYEWSANGWPEIYFNWGEQEPSASTGCVASEYSEGWKSVDCFEPRASLCRSTRDIPPTEPPIEPGLDCPEYWYAYHQQCYLINTGFTSDNLLNAVFKCSSVNGLPPSIHSREENNFISNSVLSEVTGRYVWIGLFLEEGQYKWMDGTPVDFTNWEDGEDPTLDDGKKCVWMVPEWDGRWQRQDCTQPAEVVCTLFERTMPQMTTTDPPPPQTTVKRVTPEALGLSQGAIVGIGVGGSVALLVAIIGLCFFCETSSYKKKDWPQDEHSDSNQDAEGGYEHEIVGDDVELPPIVKDRASLDSGGSGGSDNDIQQQEAML